MQNVIFISEELQSVIDKKAEAIGITTSAYISDFLENSFKNELNGVPQKSYVELYSELRQAVIDYKNTLEHGKKFTLRDVPYYAELSVTTVNGTHSISSALRARLGRSINEDIRLQKTKEFKDVRRAVTKTGKLAFRTVDNTKAAVYEKI